MNHLDAAAWRRVSQGGASAEERAHLAVPCEACEDAVALVEDGPRELAIDRALASLSGEPAGVEALGFHRVEREVMRQVFRPSRVPGRWLLGAAVAAAAAVAIIAFPPGRPVSDGLKGDAGSVPALTAVVSVKKGPLVPLEPRAYPTSAELFFTYDLPRDAHVYLGRLGSDGIVEPFFPPLGGQDTLSPAGLHPLSVGGTVHAYELEGLRGKQRFILVASPTPLAGEELTQALRAPPRSSAVLELEVEDW